MELHSLGLQTDLMFDAFEGEVHDHGDHLAVRTPSNPGYHFGNKLVFAEPPGPGDFERWTRLFRLQVGGPPRISHMAFSWYAGPEPAGGSVGASERGVGEAAPFLAAGFDLEASTVLSARALHPPQSTPQSSPQLSGVELRPLRTPTEWAQAVELQVHLREPTYGEADFRRFRERKMASYRRMTTAGMGRWYGAFLGDALVADLGVFVQGGVGRFQHVETHPDFRRRGIAGALLRVAADAALDEFGAEELVIVADPLYHAIRLYRALGFEPRERLMALSLPDARDILPQVEAGAR